jgi:hypothetical protein
MQEEGAWQGEKAPHDLARQPQHTVIPTVPALGGGKEGWSLFSESWRMVHSCGGRVSGALGLDPRRRRPPL